MKKYVVGVTGGIGSGKSLASQYLKELGFPVFSCDEINAALLTDEGYIQEVKALFPSCVIDGKVDKKALANQIFSSEENRAALERLAHPMILERLFASLAQCSTTCFAEVPLLLESGLVEKFDKILVLMRQRDSRIQSVMERDGCEEEQAILKTSSQFPYEKSFEEGYFSSEKFHLIFNDKDTENLFRQIDHFIKTLS